MTGMNKFDAKDRRRQRRSFERNHFARELASPKYHQRVIEDKKKFRPPEWWDESEEI